MMLAYLLCVLVAHTTFLAVEVAVIMARVTRRKLVFITVRCDSRQKNRKVFIKSVEMKCNLIGLSVGGV